jgi:hypothetical protein
LQPVSINMSIHFISISILNSEVAIVN